MPDCISQWRARIGSFVRWRRVEFDFDKYLEALLEQRREIIEQILKLTAKNAESSSTDGGSNTDNNAGFTPAGNSGSTQETVDTPGTNTSCASDINDERRQTTESERNCSETVHYFQSRPNESPNAATTDAASASGDDVGGTVTYRMSKPSSSSDCRKAPGLPSNGHGNIEKPASTQSPLASQTISKPTERRSPLGSHHPGGGSMGHKPTGTRMAAGSSVEQHNSSNVTEILLIKAGDVERNPGPNNQPGPVSELELWVLSELMDPHDYRKVGLALGTTEAALSRYEKDQGNSQQASHYMLYQWRKTVLEAEARDKLVVVLRDIGLVQLADSVRKGLLGDHIRPMSRALLQRSVDDLKYYYKQRFSKLQTDPLEFESRLEFDQIFTNLNLLERNGSMEMKTPLAYEDLLNTKVNGVLPKRLLVEGEGGAGKTTFCKKIVWDWMHGIAFQQFGMVLYIPLQNAKSRTVGQIVKEYLSDSNPVEARQIDEYILTNPDDVLLIFDAFDEYGGDLSDHQQQIVEILLNKCFKSCTVLVTTRPWRADKIRLMTDVRDAYAFIAVEGFTPENLAAYVTKFFSSDKESADNLNRFIEENDVIAQNMAPFPIYTAMLCVMWKAYDGERRNAMRKLQTFSQLFKEMVCFLVDHYISKVAKSFTGSALSDRRRKVFHCLSLIGQIAFRGLVERRMVFSENEFQGDQLQEAMEIGCLVGVLTREEHVCPWKERKPTSSVTVSLVQFPHKLFQEYLAGLHIASLYSSDRSEYDTLMNDVIVPKNDEFRYLLYFSSAQSKEVGLDIISHLRRSDLYIRGDFFVDVAFECHDKAAAKAVGESLRSADATLIISRHMSPHSISGYFFIIGYLNPTKLLLRRSLGRTTSSDLAEMMCSSPSLRKVEISGNDVTLHEDFLAVLATQAENSKIETLEITRVQLPDCSSASRDLARLLCEMPHLTNLTLSRLDGVGGTFFSTLASMAAKTKIETLEIERVNLPNGISASRDLARFFCETPHLTDLSFGWLDGVGDAFFSTLASLAAETKIETLKINKMELPDGASAPRDLAQFVCEMPHLTNLTLDSLDDVGDTFFSTLASMAAKTKIETLTIDMLELQNEASASRDLARFVCEMPRLTNLTLGWLDDVGDAFFSTLASMTAKTKIETLKLDWIKLSDGASTPRDLARFVCEMPRLTNLTFESLKDLGDAFFSTLTSMAAKTKIETLTIDELKLQNEASASRDLARFVCEMPHLTNLTLASLDDVGDTFFSTLASMAAKTKIETLKLDGIKLPDGASAPRDLARFVCEMPRLTNLTFKSLKDVGDAFFSTLASMAAKTKIETLTIKDVELPGEDSASRDLIARFLCEMPRLTNLTLEKIMDPVLSTAAPLASEFKPYDRDDDEQSAGHSKSISELTVDDVTLCAWRYASMSRMFPRVEKVSLKLRMPLSTDMLHKLRLPGVRELIIEKYDDTGLYVNLTMEPSTLCEILQEAFPQVVKVTLRDLRIGNDDGAHLMRGIMSHGHLKTIRLVQCNTDEGLDSAIEDINREGRVQVDAVHGRAPGKFTEETSEDESDDYESADEESDDYESANEESDDDESDDAESDNVESDDADIAGGCYCNHQ